MKQYLVRVTSFVLPAVLMLIVQQALVLGIGLSAGTARESNRFQNLVPPDRRYYHGMFRVVFGKATSLYRGCSISPVWPIGKTCWPSCCPIRWPASSLA